MDYVLEVIQENILAFFGLTVAGLSLPAVIIFLLKYSIAKNKQVEAVETAQKLEIKIDIVFTAMQMFVENTNLNSVDRNKFRNLVGRYNQLATEVSEQIQKAGNQAVVINNAVKQVKKVVKDNASSFVR